MDKKYTVFISSTFLDLKEERQIIQRAIINMGNIPVGMELFPSANKKVWTVIKKSIEISDYYIILIGNRYGTIDDSTGFSYTEMEYEFAIKLNIPILPFFIDKDSEHNDISNNEKLKAFKNKITIKHTVAYTELHEISGSITYSITEMIKEEKRAGWIRGAQDIKKIRTNPDNSNDKFQEIINRLSSNKISLKIYKARRIDYRDVYKYQATRKISYLEFSKQVIHFLLFNEPKVELSIELHILKNYFKYNSDIDLIFNRTNGHRIGDNETRPLLTHLEILYTLNLIEPGSINNRVVGTINTWKVTKFGTDFYKSLTNKVD